MAAITAPATTAAVAALHDRVTRFVFASFHRKLTFEEARDAAAEALSEADRAVAAGQRIGDLNAWLCTAAWRNAISMVRRLEGEGKRKRLRPVDVTEQGEWILDERDVEGEILTFYGRRSEHEALRAAWGRLKPDEQRALYLRYFDELPVGEVLSILGCSRHHYENLTKRGLRKLRDALVADARHDGCRRCRTAIVDGHVAALPADEVAHRDAHLSSCLPCRAFQRRQRGLIAVLPLPAAGFLDGLTARLHALTGSGGAARSGEVAAGTVAVAAAGSGAGAGVVGAGGGALAVGGAAKTVAALCSAGAVTAGVCVGGVPFSKPEPREPRPAAAAERQAKAPPAAPLVAVKTQAPPVTSSAVARPPAATSATPRPPRAVVRAQKEEAARRASSPFLPESAGAASLPAATASSTRPRPTTFSGRSAPPAPTRSTSSTASARTAFSEEFTP